MFGRNLKCSTSFTLKSFVQNNRPNLSKNSVYLLAPPSSSIFRSFASGRTRMRLRVARTRAERGMSSFTPGNPYIPPIMEFPHLHLPSLSNTFRNTLLSRTLIRPYFDEDFRIGEFVKGAKYAAAEVSQSLITGDLEALEDNCTQHCIQTINKNLSLFSMKQRSELDLKQEDIFYSFLYQIGVLMDDEPDSEGRYGRQVECTWVGHAFRNYLDVVEEQNGNPMKIKDVLDKERGPTILNFRFIRNYSKGVEDSWTINALNYFKLYDI